MPDGRPACRFCGAPLVRSVVDLGMSPLCESFLPADRADAMEPFYPLHVRVCDECLLVQLPAYVPPEEIFREYAYFSSYSDSWLTHAREYVERVVDRFGLGRESFVVEVASNDGYLLRDVVDRGIPCLGIEPARNVAQMAASHGVETLTEFFGEDTARSVVAERGNADLVVANNVYAHVPDINDFTRGLQALLGHEGVVTIEVQDLKTLVQRVEYDTIYHEHFSYLTVSTARRILAEHGLETFDVEFLPTHGGSMRLFAGHAGVHEVQPSVERALADDNEAGFGGFEVYEAFREAVEESKRALVSFLIGARRDGRQVAAYGAPGKGNTLLNYCGIRTDLIDYAVDRNPYKHGRLTPGTHIPIHPPERLAETQPDVIVILPWNLRDEIARQLDYTRSWGATLWVPIPSVTEVAA
jgi:hypothetical protein